MDKVRINTVLKQIYSKSLEGLYTESVDGLNSLMVNNLVNFYVYTARDIDSIDIENIQLIIEILQQIYNNSDIIPPITDELYDMLYAVYNEASNNDIVGAGNPTNKTIGYHKYPDLRGTLSKTHFFLNSDKGPKESRKSIEQWIDSIENKIGHPLRDSEKEVYVFPKFDGLSVVFECDPEGNVMSVLTRGDVGKNEALILTPLFDKKVKFIPYAGWEGQEFGVKTEVIMTEPSYERLCTKYGSFHSRRSAVSSILNSINPDPKFLEYLTIVPLRMQNYVTKEVIVHPDAFSLYPYETMNLDKLTEMEPVFNKIRGIIRDDMKIPMDGIVLYLTNKELQTVLGRENDINKYEVAYKFPPESKKTILLDVEFCIGNLGMVSPVAKVRPVKINYNNISSISLNSMDRFETLNLHIGDEVIVKYDIIPYLIKDDTCAESSNPKVLPPTHCEYCGEELINNPVLKCDNPECPSRIIGKILNYIVKAGLSNISIATVTTFFKHGYLKSIEDLYRLERYKSDIIQLDGFGKKSFEDIIAGIHSRTTMYDYELFGSLGIPDVAQKIFKRILNIYYMDDLMEICKKGDVKKLTSIRGIKEKTANKIVIGVITNLKLIEFLRRELKIKHDDRSYKMRVVFTKIRDKEFEKFLDSIGVLVMDNYTKETDVVITENSLTDSGKVKSALRDGKKVITIQDAYRLFKYDNAQ